MLILRIGENTKKRISFDKDILKANSIINTSNIDSLLDYCHANMFGEKLIIRIEEIFATTRASNTKDSESSEQEIESIYEDNVNIDKNEPIDYKKRIYANLENIILSENIFIIDEVSVLAPTAKKLIEDSIKFVTNNKLTKEHFVLLDARLTDAEKKIKEKAEDSNPFPFCNALSIQDKKTAWIELMKLKYTDCVDMELIGATMWKMKTLRNKNKYYDLLMIMNNSKKRDGIKIYDKLEEIVLNLK